ncbi:MAG: hypothetical protein ABW219_10220 [Ilumatobacteraceae bacterium]
MTHTASATAAATASAARRPFRPRRSWLGPALVVLAVTPILVATIRTLARGWVVAGDNGLLLLRSQDVGTGDHPLLGTWTSASLTAGRSINNPGPLWFDVLSPFYRLAGPSVGFAVGVMVANVAAVVLAAWAARRAGGETGLIVVTLLSAGLAWSMGSELLFDAWQPHAMILPGWAFLVGAWALSCGDLAVAPWLVGGASLLVQTHLSYVFLVAILGAASIVAAVVLVARDHPDPGERRPVLVRAGLLSLVVAVVAWLQPLIDQFFGEGNLGALLRSSGGGDGPRIGLRLGSRLAASVIALPPWWGRSGFSATIVSTGVVTTGGRLDVAEGGVAGPRAAAGGLLVVFAVLTAVIVSGWRRRRRSTVAVGGVAAVAVIGALVALTLTPVSQLGISPHQMRWLWPVAALVTLAPLFALGDWAPARRAVTAVATATTLVLVVLALPTYAAPEGPTADREYGPTIAALVEQVEEYRTTEPVVFDTSVLRFAEPYSGPVLATLGRNGVPFRVADEITVRQVGTGRRADGTETDRLVLLEGAAAQAPPAGATTVAFVDGLDPSERAELDELRTAVLAAASETGVTLNQDGLDAVAGGRLDAAAEVLAPGADAVLLADSGLLPALIDEGWIDLDPASAAAFRRYAELAERGSRFTVGLFELPVAPGP